MPINSKTLRKSTLGFGVCLGVAFLILVLITVADSGYTLNEIIEELLFGGGQGAVIIALPFIGFWYLTKNHSFNVILSSSILMIATSLVALTIMFMSADAQSGFIYFYALAIQLVTLAALALTKK